MERSATRTGLIVGAVALAVAIVAVVMVVVLGGDDPADSPAPTAPATSAPTTSEPDSTTSPGDGGTETTDAEADGQLADGRHPVYLTRIDTDAGTIEFDLIQFLTGDEAQAAFAETFPDEPDGPPNDYFIVNENPRLRTMSVVDDASITVLDWESGFEPRSISFGELPEQLSNPPLVEDGRLWPNPFWLTVAGGAVTGIEEQYLP